MKHYMYRSRIQYHARRAVKVIPALFNRLVKVGVFTFDRKRSITTRLPKKNKI